jgi:hypothetical protein
MSAARLTSMGGDQTSIGLGGPASKVDATVERELTHTSVCAWLSTGSKPISTNRGRSNSCCTSLA